MPLTASLTLIGLVPWWAIIVAMGEVALCIVALRLAAVREQTARHTDRSMRRVAVAAGSAPEAGADASEPPAEAEASVAPVQPAYRPGDTTWNPVPVPRPTYQLKDPAPAPRPEPEPAPAPAASEPAESRPSRRAAGG